MLGAGKPVGFIPVREYGPARAFYEGVLGLEIVEVGPFALVARSGDLVIRITQAPPFTPHPFTILGWEVTGIEATVAALVARGVSFERYPWFGDAQGAEGIWTAPGGDRVAWFKDPDGNTLSLSEPARSTSDPALG